MNASWFRVAVLIVVGAMGYWYWQDRQAREDAAAPEREEQAERQRSQAYEAVHKPADRAAEAAQSYDDRVKKQQVDE